MSQRLVARKRGTAVQDQQSAMHSCMSHQCWSLPQAVPTRKEATAVQQGLAAVRAAAQRIWPQSTATLFGSQVSTLLEVADSLRACVTGYLSNMEILSWNGLLGPACAQADLADARSLVFQYTSTTVHRLSRSACNLACVSNGRRSTGCEGGPAGGGPGHCGAGLPRSTSWRAAPITQ